MKDFKLKIDLLPKGAWNNDFSKTLSKKDWDTVRNFCYEKANGRCQICGYETEDLDAHEMWEFNIEKQTQTLKDIVGICSRCHGVIHFKNSVRMGYEKEAKEHFIKTNKCSELDFASHLTQAVETYNERNKILRWKMIADLSKFGGAGIQLKSRYIPYIDNPYKNVDWTYIGYNDIKKLFNTKKYSNSLLGAPIVNSVNVDNYQGNITVSSLFANKIEWYLDGKRIKRKYNTAGKFITTFNVENLIGLKLSFTLFGYYGQTISKAFDLYPLEVL